MGTKVHCKSYLPDYYSMRDLNEDSSSSSWPLFYGDNGITNGQYYNGFVPRNIIDGYPGYDKDTLKQKMLEHEAVFKNQVLTLPCFLNIPVIRESPCVAFPFLLRECVWVAF